MSKEFTSSIINFNNVLGYFCSSIIFGGLWNQREMLNDNFENRLKNRRKYYDKKKTQRII